MSTPLTRTLPAVLREAVDRGAGLQLVVATCGTVTAPPAGNAYVDVVINSAHVTVPKLNGAKFATGTPCYLLALGDFLLYLGPVSTTAL